tara:strand:+ start:276 stop:827 length:552 start_codon:yes stop_codon:yes gene_type:complete
MIKDINLIRKELENHEEIDLPCEIDKNIHIKYISRNKKGEDSFYNGGKFICYGNNCIVLKNNSRTWSVPIDKKKPDGSVDWKSRFFILEEKEDEENCEENIKEYKEIIKYQQSIIETMKERMIELELIKKKLSHEKTEYEELLQQSRYNLKEKCIENREKEEKIKRYEDIIQKLTHSHQIFHK